LQEYGLCFFSLSAEESHGSISSFLGRNLLDVVDVLDFVSLLITNTVLTLSTYMYVNNLLKP